MDIPLCIGIRFMPSQVKSGKWYIIMWVFVSSVKDFYITTKNIPQHQHIEN